MARETRIVLVDDLDGSSGHESISFSINGTDYEIDLNESHASQFYAAIEPYVAVAQQHMANREVDSKQVRRWAAENGIAVKSRGRIHPSVIDQFLKLG